MALTEREKQIIEFGKRTGKSKDEILNAVSEYRLQNPRASITQESETPGRLEETMQDLGQVGTGIAEDFNAITEDVGRGFEAQQAGKQSPISTGLQLAGGVGRTIGSIAGRAVQGVGKALVTQEAEENISESIQDIATSVIESDIGTWAVDEYNQLDEETQRNIRAGFGIFEGIATLGGGGVISSTGRAGVKTGVKAVGETATQVGEGTVDIAQRLTPSFIKTSLLRVPGETREEIVTNTARNIEDSLIENKSTINKIQKIANRQGTTETELIRKLVDEGGIPEVRGDRADFDGVLVDFSERQNALGAAIQKRLEPVQERTELSALRSRVEQTLRESPQIDADLDQSLREVDRIFKSLENTYGNQVSASDLNQIRINMNRKTGAFKGEQFLQDTENALGRIAGSRVDEIVGDDIVQMANKKWGELQSLKQTAKAMQLEKISVGELAETLGSLTGAIAAGALGFGVAGLGGLVIASFAARYGSRVVANLIRSRKFNSDIKEKLSEGIRRDEEIVEKLLREANAEDRATLERVLLPPPSQTPIPQPARGQRNESTVETVPAQRGEPGRNPQTGRFFRTFRSGQ